MCVGGQEGSIPLHQNHLMIIRKDIYHNRRFTVITNYDVIGRKSEALIRINFMLGTFHQPKSNPHKK